MPRLFLLSGTNTTNNERNGIIRRSQSRKAVTQAKKATVTNSKPFKLATLFASVLAMLAFVGLARANEPTSTSTASALTQAEVDSQRRIAAITERTEQHKSRADMWGHKMRTHLKAAHRPLASAPSVEAAQRRLTLWASVDRRAKARYLKWKRVQMCKRPRPLVPSYVTVKHKRATLHQRQVLTEALNVSRQRNARFKVHQALVAGITQESTAHNRASGHGTSVGVMQLIDTHGSVRWRMHIPNSVNWFLNGVIPDDRRNPHLSITQLVQRQQRSAHPTLYQQWAPEAARTVKAFLGPCGR